jgi:hypothetical protein
MLRGRGWMLVKLGLFGLCVAVLTSGIAWAMIPSSSGVITACYTKKDGSLRVIDAEAGDACKAKETTLTWNQAGPSPPPPPPLGSVDIDYVEKTTDVSITQVTPGTAVTVIKSNAKTYDGSRIYIDFFSASITSTVGNHIWIDVYRDSTLLGELGYYLTPSTTEQSKSFQVSDVPSAGTHTYTLKAYVGGQATVRGAPDTADGLHLLPMHLRITRV